VSESGDFGLSEYEQHIERMKKRTKDLALRVIQLFRALPKDEAARIVGRQLLRSATSVGANYRAACRVRTGREFAAKLRIVCEESDESQYWMELLTESGIVRAGKLRLFHAEATELVAIFTKALETTRRKLKSRP
jgi:four helix bundle protein